jgi:putative ABC transport system permease protein
MNHVLGTTQLALAAALVLLSAGLSLALQMGIARSVLVSAVRTVVQLLLVGLVLREVFQLRSPLLVALVMAAMLATAAYETLSRQQRRFKGPWGAGLGAATTTIASVLVTVFAVATLHPDPWFAPSVVIPLFGIVLGNVMSSVSVTLNAFNTSLASERTAVEAQLALGATRYAALAQVQRSALRSGMIPIVNQMSAAGVITLPGMMTGQILAGMSPFEAAKYQVFVLFLLCGASCLGALGATLAAAWRATDDRHRLRLDRTAPRS